MTEKIVLKGLNNTARTLLREAGFLLDLKPDKLITNCDWYDDTRAVHSWRQLCEIALVETPFIGRKKLMLKAHVLPHAR